MALPKSPTMTEAEYLAFELDSDLKHEFVNGYIYAITGASQTHNDISTNILTHFHNQFRGRNCTVNNSDTRISLSNLRNYYYPDVTLVCGERLFAEDTTISTILNPTVIIEVLSPSTELYDRPTKFAHYQQIESLQDYVLVSQDKAFVECYSRGENKSWIYTKADEIEASLLIPSVDISLALVDVYQQIDFPD